MPHLRDISFNLNKKSLFAKFLFILHTKNVFCENLNVIEESLLWVLHTKNLF